jgi:hypothetical protein
VTVADQILLWLAGGAQQRQDLEQRARTAFGIRDSAAAEVRVSLALVTLTRRGLVSLHPVHGFRITPAGKAKTATPRP